MIEVIDLVDDQLAVHITDEEEDQMLEEFALLDAVDFNAAPFDEWRMDENREMEELLRLPDDLFTDAEREKIEDQQEVSHSSHLRFSRRIPIRRQCTERGVLSVAIICHVFPCELRGSARAVGTYSISQSARGNFPKHYLQNLAIDRTPRSVVSVLS